MPAKSNQQVSEGFVLFAAILALQKAVVMPIRPGHQDIPFLGGLGRKAILRPHFEPNIRKDKEVEKHTEPMAVVKLTKKDELDKLIANLTLRLGKRVSQQSVLDACIHLSSTHIDELESYCSDKSHLSRKRVAEILEMAEDFDYDTKGSDDKDLYEE